MLAKLIEFNPKLPAEAYRQAIEELTRDRSAMIPVNANHEVYRLLKDGVKVSFKDADGGTIDETLKVIDWNTPANNDFFLASQCWIRGELYLRRTDLLGFVNGLPLLFIELKAAHRNIENAYRDNLRDYKTAIPQLFIPNAVVILSNGSETRVGTITAEWEHFFEWKKISDEEEAGVISLETVLRGVCEPTRFLDLVENFTVFEEVRGGLVKKVAKNHQYLGVNKAIQAVTNLEDNQGRLGVFWHTQGSGKSLSMVFFTQKILRKIPGNWTFVVVTDRAANEIAHDAVVFGVLVQKIRSLSEPADISAIMRDVEVLLDESIATEGYIINAPVGQELDSAGLFNLSEINFEELTARFKARHTNAPKPKNSAPCWKPVCVAWWN